jgi:riboflavin kinase/FMN adenylyltransferase
MLTATIGNFDGVHIGHQSLLARARAVSSGDEVVAVTFDAHPALLTRGSPPPALTHSDSRAELLRASGASRVETLALTRELLAMDPDQFVRWLRALIPFAAIVVGEDFRFGRGRAGDAVTLQRLGEAMSFSVHVVAEMRVRLSDGHEVGAHSSVARWLIGLGRVADAARILGRPHSVSGIVVEGEGRGRGLGFPTANVSTGDALLPADGVYAVRVRDGSGQWWRGAASIGTNPTFHGQRRTLEVHILEMPLATDLYGTMLRVEFTQWIREMLAFESVDALVDRMHADCARVPA